MNFIHNFVTWFSLPAIWQQGQHLAVNVVSAGRFRSYFGISTSAELHQYRLYLVLKFVLPNGRPLFWKRSCEREEKWRMNSLHSNRPWRTSSIRRLYAGFSSVVKEVSERQPAGKNYKKIYWWPCHSYIFFNTQLQPGHSVGKSSGICVDNIHWSSSQYFRCLWPKIQQSPN